MHIWDVKIQSYCHYSLFCVYCYRAKAQDYTKKGRNRLNYRCENSTPRDRYEGGAFHENYRSCKSRQSSNTTQNCGCTQQRGYEQPKRCNFRRNGSSRPVCGSDNGHLHREAPIAMVYSPMQQWKELYDPTTALNVGTIFKELDLPFYPTPCRRKENSSCQYR